MQELVVISGKGGTGKTSIAASLAVLAGQVVVADCDVDAADMHLLLSPQILEKHLFQSGNQAIIRQEACNQCGLCHDYCRFDAVQKLSSEKTTWQYVIDPAACEGCGVCVHFCPQQAIDFPEALCGEWMISATRTGPLVHARLKAAAENSGKLVTMVRQQARQVAEKNGHALIITDGPPGIGCPVIASITGANRILAVTEPTVSGVHDLERVLDLAKHFGIPADVCINKWDLNPDMGAAIEKKAAERDLRIVGRIPYDPGITRAQLLAKTMVETGTTASQSIRNMWEEIKSKLI